MSLICNFQLHIRILNSQIDIEKTDFFSPKINVRFCDKSRILKWPQKNELFLVQYFVLQYNLYSI